MDNIFNFIPADLSKEIVERLVDSNTVKIERIISKGHKSPASGWYDQDTNEWVLVLTGKAIVSFVEDPSLTLKQGDFINIPAHKKHKVEWTDPDIETIWLAIHY